ncbi:MAG: glycosyltransferase family 2 protein [bacterium]|nr:glycosyltransferase family 2 protein [bacterium]
MDSYQNIEDVPVSICIPAYNAGLFIRETLESLISQTHHNIEIIVSDNCSTDNTEDIVTDLQKQDSRIKYYRASRNLGYILNIRNAISHTKNKIITVYHADDVYDKKIIRKQLEVIVNNQNIGAVFSAVYDFSKNDKSDYKLNKIYSKLKNKPVYNAGKEIFIGKREDFLPIILKFGNIFTCPTFMTYKDIYKNIGGYMDTYPSNEDFDLWLRILSENYRIAMISEPLMFYRHSINQGSNLFKDVIDLPMMYKVLLDYRTNNKVLFDNLEVEKKFKQLMSKGFCKACKIAHSKNYEKYLFFKKESLSYWRFSLFNKYGIYQRFSTLYHLSVKIGKSLIFIIFKVDDKEKI